MLLAEERSFFKPNTTCFAAIFYPDFKKRTLLALENHFS